MFLGSVTEPVARLGPSFKERLMLPLRSSKSVDFPAPEGPVKRYIFPGIKVSFMVKVASGLFLRGMVRWIELV